MCPGSVKLVFEHRFIFVQFSLNFWHIIEKYFSSVLGAHLAVPSAWTHPYACQESQWKPPWCFLHVPPCRITVKDKNYFGPKTMKSDLGNLWLGLSEACVFSTLPMHDQSRMAVFILNRDRGLCQNPLIKSSWWVQWEIECKYCSNIHKNMVKSALEWFITTNKQTNKTHPTNKKKNLQHLKTRKHLNSWM